MAHQSHELPTNAGPADRVDIRKYVPMTYAGAGRGWVPFDTGPIVEKLASRPRSQTEQSPTFDGVSAEALSESWRVQTEVGFPLSGDTTKDLGMQVKPAALRREAAETARARRAEAREIRLGRVARRMSRTPDQLVELLGVSKATKWASGASRGKVSKAKPSIDERAQISFHQDGAGLLIDRTPQTDAEFDLVWTEAPNSDEVREAPGVAEFGIAELDPIVQRFMAGEPLYELVLDPGVEVDPFGNEAGLGITNEPVEIVSLEVEVLQEQGYVSAKGRSRYAFAV